MHKPRESALTLRVSWASIRLELHVVQSLHSLFHLATRSHFLNLQSRTITMDEHKKFLADKLLSEEQPVSLFVHSFTYP